MDGNVSLTKNPAQAGFFIAIDDPAQRCASRPRTSLSESGADGRLTPRDRVAR
jgi:hypothetical protein